ncbi:MAG: mechanosensitive ion channel domain-containing protein [Pseudomonadota bacterium]|mgnify:FL=1
MMPADSFNIEIATVWRDVTLWLSLNSTRILMVVVFSALLVVVLYGVRMLGKRMSRHSGQWTGIIGRALSSMRLWFMVALAAQLVAVYAHAPADVRNTTGFIFIFAATFQAALFLRELILGTVELRAGEADPSGSLGSALGLIRLLINVALFVIALIVILANLGVNVTGLVAGLGVGGIAIGLAAQGIFSDLFAALSILFDKPFRRGDAIRWEGTMGTVEAIGLKSTRIRAISGEEVVISNTNLLGKELRNFARLERRRIIQPLSVVYQTPLETCAALPEMLRVVIDGCEGCHFVRCGLDTFAPSSLDFQLVYDVDAEDQDAVLMRKHAANIAVIQCFARAAIDFAYPTQTTFTAAPDGTMVMPYAQLPGGDVIKR